MLGVPSDPSFILLHSQTIDTRLVRSLDPSTSARGLGLHTVLLVQIRAESMMHAAKENLEKIGVQVLDFVPHKSFIVMVPKRLLTRLNSIPEVQWIGELEPSDKISASINASDTLMMLKVHTVPFNSKLAIREVVEIAGQVHADVNVPDEAEHRVVLHFPDEDALQLGTQRLSLSPFVLFIERMSVANFSNLHSRSIVQNGLETEPDFRARTGLLSWDYNLLGQNQVIGLADSGMDLNSCFFAETDKERYPNPPFYNFEQDSDIKFRPEDAGRRKVVQYVTFADDIEIWDLGHGTHVGGTLAGYPHSPTLSHVRFSGMAPFAKIAFFDIGKDNGVHRPSDLANDMFEWQYAAGARIHSNSWGIKTNAYTSEARDVDAFMYKHRDSIVLFAAGNNGHCASALGSLSSPGSSKVDQLSNKLFDLFRAL